ncbi:MAG: hypothetical protein M1831_001013 [Alyxoria varia]|nr:MAG: hypothetical protein M1831_001013 [Alyxoria varia]
MNSQESNSFLVADDLQQPKAQQRPQLPFGGGFIQSSSSAVLQYLSLNAIGSGADLVPSTSTQAETEKTISNLRHTEATPWQKQKTGFAFSNADDQTLPCAKTPLPHAPLFRNNILLSNKICSDLKLTSILNTLSSDSASQSSLPLAKDIPDGHLTIISGKNVGELIALYAARALSRWDLMFLIGERAKMMEANKLACYYLPGECMSMADWGISKMWDGVLQWTKPEDDRGTESEIQLLYQYMQVIGDPCKNMPMANAFNLAQMDLIVEVLSPVTNQICFQKTQLPSIAELPGKVLP